MHSTGGSGSTEVEPAARRSLEETARDLALGASVASWAVLGMWHAPADERVSPVRLALFALNACVGVLFLVRAPVARSAGTLSLAAAVPSMVLGGVALRLAPPAPTWSPMAIAVFVAGVVWAIVSLCTLGKSFALLPALRTAVVSGPFRLVRHPTYAGEILMIAACGLASSALHALALTAAAVLLVAPRVIVEERLLREDAGWRAYAERVRWRLVPGIW
jgi:protein-S-isoprenylcysteine O-methyltransferase Ste14